MEKSGEFIWKGEANRQFGAYRPCKCGVCSRDRKGVGYLSFSDANGNGFTIWIKREKIFQRLRRVFLILQSRSRSANSQ